VLGIRRFTSGKSRVGFMARVNRLSQSHPAAGSSSRCSTARSEQTTRRAAA
jgi:hypothetical protein